MRRHGSLSEAEELPGGEQLERSPLWIRLARCLAFEECEPAAGEPEDEFGMVGGAMTGRRWVEDGASFLVQDDS